MIVSWNSDKTGYTSVEALEYRVTKWPTGQPQDEPFVMFQTLEHSEPMHKYVQIEHDSIGRFVLSVLRTVDKHTDWEHFAVERYYVNNGPAATPTDLAEFDPFNYYQG